MILHLFHDDKVCNQVITNFEEVYPGGNIYVCICNKENLKFIKRNNNIIFLNIGEYDFDQSRLLDVEKILIHYLDVNKIEFIEKNYPRKSNVEIYWSLWGGDIYNEILYSMGFNIYDEKSYTYTLKFKLINFINRCLARPNLKKNIKRIVSFIDTRVDYVMAFQADYDLICEKWKSNHFRPKCISNLPIYYPIEEILGSLHNQKINGNNIVIGNSASFTNNHAYAYQYLSKVDTTGIKKISPLSYGGSLKYLRHIKTIGYKYWGKDYYPLENFMPLHEYNKLMLSTSIYVYGNWRQEAIGNIVMALYLGAKVYVSEKSTLLKIFSDFGIKLHKTELISSTNFFEKEDDITIQQNQQNILKLYSKKAILDHIKTIFG